MGHLKINTFRGRVAAYPTLHVDAVVVPNLLYLSPIQKLLVASLLSGNKGDERIFITF